MYLTVDISYYVVQYFPHASMTLPPWRENESAGSLCMGYPSLVGKFRSFVGSHWGFGSLLAFLRLVGEVNLRGWAQ